MNTSSSSDQDTVDRLAEEFVARQRRGEHPDLAEYTDRYPQYAEAIRDLFPALVLIEQVKPAAGEPTGTHHRRGRGRVRAAWSDWATTGFSAKWAGAAWAWSTRPNRSR